MGIGTSIFLIAVGAFWSSWGGVRGLRRGTVADGGVRRRRVIEDEVV
jgi:hypothetical protein